jgi:hypothetical protein
MREARKRGAHHNDESTWNEPRFDNSKEPLIGNVDGIIEEQAEDGEERLKKLVHSGPKDSLA